MQEQFIRSKQIIMLYIYKIILTPSKYKLHRSSSLQITLRDPNRAGAVLEIRIQTGQALSIYP